MNLETFQQRTAAQQYPCTEPRCGAGVGDTCRNVHTGEYLDARPAHESRLWAAGVTLGPTPHPTARTAQETR